MDQINLCVQALAKIWIIGLSALPVQLMAQESQISPGTKAFFEFIFGKHGSEQPRVNLVSSSSRGTQSTAYRKVLGSRQAKVGISGTIYSSGEVVWEGRNRDDSGGRGGDGDGNGDGGGQDAGDDAWEGNAESSSGNGTAITPGKEMIDRDRPGPERELPTVANIQGDLIGVQVSKAPPGMSDSQMEEWVGAHQATGELAGQVASSGVVLGSVAYELHQAGDSKFGEVCGRIASETLQLAGEVALESPPVLGTIIGMTEAATGTDVPSGEALTLIERGISFVGEIAGLLPGGKAGVTVLSKFFDALAKGTARLADKATKQFGKLAAAAKQADKIVSSAKKGEWSKVFSDKVRPSELLKNSSLEKKFRADKKIPSNWETKFSKKGEGAVFHEPGNPHTDIRVMPGKPNSSHPNSRKPYVEVKKNGKHQDKNGNPLPNNRNEDAHIPLDEFQFPF